MAEEVRTRWVEPNGSAKDGVSCTACGRTYRDCTMKLRGGRGCCCPTCYQTGTHAERTLPPLIDEEPTPEQRAEALIALGRTIWEGLGQLVGDPVVVERAKHARRRAALQGRLDAALAESDRLRQELEAAKAKLDVVRRPVDLSALAKMLFMERMMAAYQMPSDTAEKCWRQMSTSYQKQWLDVATRASQQLLATDIEPS